MSTLNNRIQGRNLDHSEVQLLQALAALAPQWIVYPTCAENPARLALTSGIVWGAS